MRSRFALALAAASSLLPIQSALAQDAADEEEIVVTAQKREQVLMDVPAAVSVVSGERLEQSGASSLADYAAYVPGLNFTSGGSPGQTTITLRGVSPLGPSASVGTYIDDAPLGSSTFHARASQFALDLFPYDINQIEVVRGPQGTLYGASAMGGIIKYITRRPDTTDFSARIGGDVRSINEGGDDSFGLRGAVNVPLSENVAVSASAFTQHTAGWIDNVVTGQDDVNELDQTGGRLALLWEISPRATIYLASMFQRTESADNNQAWYDFDTGENPINGDLDMGQPLPSPFTQEVSYYSAIGEFDLGWADFTSVTSYSTVDATQVQDASLDFASFIPLLTGDPTSTALTPFQLDLGLEKFTQELRLASSGEHMIDWLVGLFYTDESSSNDQLISALDPTTLAPITGLHPLALIAIPYEFKELAVFGNVTINFSDRFDVGLGVRYSHNEDVFTQFGEGPALGPTINNVGEAEDEVATYSVNPRFRISDDLMIYGRYATGYRPGGANVALANVPPTVGADTIESYELGVKGSIGNMFDFEAAVFQNTWENIQTATGASGVTWLVNSDGAEMQGVELSGVLSVTSDFRVGANVAYVDAQFAGPSAGVGAADGAPLPQVPEWQGALTADYDRELSNGALLSVSAGWRYVGDQVFYDPAFGAGETPNYDIADIRAGVRFDNWNVRVFANNVFDERPHLNETLHYDLVTGAPLFTSASIGQPRTIGIAFDREF